MKSARLGFNYFVLWNFDLVTKEHLEKIDGLGDLALAIPMLSRVRQLPVEVTSDGDIFVS